MLLIGNNCVSLDEERTQMAIWSIVAAPLIMGNDPRNISAASKAILTNADAIAVNQDALGQQGLRLDNSSSAPAQRWYRVLANGDVAVALYNKLGSGGPAPPCPSWNTTANGYFDSSPPGSGGADCFSGLSLDAAKAQCCADTGCAGFSIDANGDGCNKPNAAGAWTPSSTYSGYDKPNFAPPTNPVDITIQFADINLKSPVQVYDIWAQAQIGAFTDSFTAKAVPFHGTGFFRMSGAAPPSS
jgi:hypothetical protein